MGVSATTSGDPKRIEAGDGASMWSYWENLPAKQRPSWEQFQNDFRTTNPGLAADGQLNKDKVYYVPAYAPTPGEGSGAPDQATQGAGEQNVPAGRADGSSPASAIQLSGADAMNAVTRDKMLEVLKPDAFVVGVRGTIGVQEIPGWEKVPGLKNLGKDQKVGYLLATLTPMKIDGTSIDFTPHDTTMFLSLKIPGVNNPLVATFKPSDLTVEGGIAFNAVDKPGGVIWFSNVREGVSGPTPETVDSVNAGVIFEVPGIKNLVGKFKDLIKKVTRGTQAAQAGAAIVGAPETGGGSLVAGAGSIAATELLRGTISNSLDNAQWYLGAAWRGETRMPISQDGTVTIQGNASGWEGKWVTFNFKDVAQDVLGIDIPDLTGKKPHKNTQSLIDAGMDPERADLMATGMGGNISPLQLLEQTAAHLKVPTKDLIDWFNQQDKHWVGSFAYGHMRMMSPEEGDAYPVEPPPEAPRRDMPMGTYFISDLVQWAEIQEHPMPRG